jgi:hypothetical protein
VDVGCACKPPGPDVVGVGAFVAVGAEVGVRTGETLGLTDSSVI